MVRAARTKTLAATLNASQARSAVTRHLQKLNSSCNVTQFTAQLHEKDMVELLASFAQDTSGAIPPALRRQCAIDVLTFARGQPRPWLHDGLTVDPNSPGQSGFNATVAEEIAAAKLTADLYRQLNDLTARNIHPRDWPENIRAISTDIVAYYEAEEDNEILRLQ
jgi:hypothetical protein